MITKSNWCIATMIPYLIDANVIITAYLEYYRLDKIPQFWEWLLAKGEQGLIKIPPAIFGEIRPLPNHPMHEWLRQPAVLQHLVLAEDPESHLINLVLDEGYGKGRLDWERERVTRDATLIASAMSGNGQFGTVVTRERSSKRVMQPHKRKIPDVCEDLGVHCISDFTLYFDVLDFCIPIKAA